jgi:hypothetical protein
MKIGQVFTHYPTRQRGQVKGHLRKDGTFLAWLPAENMFRRVRLRETKFGKAKPQPRKVMSEEEVEQRKKEAEREKKLKLQGI